MWLEFDSDLMPHVWLSLLLVLVLLRGFFPISTKTSISKFQFDQDRGLAWTPTKADVAFSLNIVIYFFYKGHYRSLSQWFCYILIWTMLKICLITIAPAQNEDTKWIIEERANCNFLLASFRDTTEICKRLPDFFQFGTRNATMCKFNPSYNSLYGLGHLLCLQIFKIK